MSEEVKQVIAVRRDLKMRRGKECSQVAHASMAALLDEMDNRKLMFLTERVLITNPFRDPIHLWLSGAFVKIVVKVNSEDELFDVFHNALAYTCNDDTTRVKMPCSIIKDNGKTEFKGVPTFTCCAVGPWWAPEIDKITGHLELL